MLLLGLPFVTARKGKIALKQIYLGLMGGLVLYSLYLYISRMYFSSFSNFGYFILIVFGVIYLIKQNLRLKFSRPSLLLTILIILGSVFVTTPVFRSGTLINGNLSYWGALEHDGVWHEALVNQLIKSVPPQNPIYAGSNLTGYHYFYDLLVAQTSLITRINPRDLIYRLFPVLFSLLLGIGTYILSLKLFRRKQIALFSVFFAYFGSSLGWIVTLLKNGAISGESVFWMNQPVSFNINPPFAISLLIYIGFILALFEYNKNKSLKIGVLIILLVTSLVGFKVYASVISLGSLGLVGMLNLIKEKRWDTLVIFFLTLITSVVLFLTNNILTSSVLVFKPFWFLNSMIDADDRVGWVKLSLARQAYESTGAYYKYILLQLFVFLLFIIGNLGTRIFAVFTDFKKYLKENILIHLLILSGLLISFTIPMLFIQKGNSWNTIQFGYYGLYFIGLYAGASLYSISKSMGKLGTAIVFLLIIFTPLSSLMTFANAFSQPNYQIMQNEAEALLELATYPDKNILIYPGCSVDTFCPDNVCPTHCFDRNSIVSALSGKATYLSDKGQNEILLTELHSRMINTLNFLKFNGSIDTDDFIKENNIGYIYVSDPRSPKLNYDMLYSKNGITIYKTQ